VLDDVARHHGRRPGSAHGPGPVTGAPRRARSMPSLPAAGRSRATPAGRAVRRPVASAMPTVAAVPFARVCRSPTANPWRPGRR
jgi:hypothetical protein